MATISGIKTKPDISVIIIFLNEEKFIGEAIESVISQSYKNWELILVDDGSTDSSIEIAKNYVKAYPEKICYFDHPSHQNKGMSASRNLGIKKSNGKYIAFLDADDIWLPQKLEQQKSIFNLWPDADMVYGRTMIWNSWNRNSSAKDQFYELGNEPDNLIKPPDLFFLLLENKFQSPTTCNAIMRRRIFEKIGMFDEKFRGMYEDQVFFSKVLLESKVFVSGQIWAKYRQHPESCSIKSENNNYYLARIPFLKWLLNYLDELGFENNSKVLKVSRREYWLCKHPLIYGVVSKYLKVKNKIL